MTGAGAGELLIAREQSLGGSLVDGDTDGNADLYAPGRNESLDELNLQRQLQRMREADAVESVESIAQNLEGAVAISATISSDVHDEIEKIVFNAGPGSSFTSGRANSAAIFTSIDYLSGTATRKLIGCIPLSYEVSYTQGENVTYTLTMGYQDEERDVTIPTGDITRVSDDTSAPFHEFDLTVDAGSVAKLQSATLTIDNIARFQRGTSHTPVDAVIANPQTTLDAEVIINTTSKLELAYGADSATATQAAMNSVSGSVAVAANGTTVSTYSLPQLKPDQYGWNQIIDVEDATETYTMHVNGGVTVS